MLTQNLLSKLKFSIAERKIIIGFDKFCKTKPVGRALLSYLVHPLLLPIPLWEKKLFSNRGIAIQIVRALNELGYVVDIVDMQNARLNPSRSYDLFIGHGGKNFEILANKLNKNIPKIYFGTGSYWKYWNINQAKRFYEFTLRTGYILPPDRYIQYDEEYASTKADGIICLGNKFILNSFPHPQHVININNGFFPIPDYSLASKDYSNGKNHFLFFSGRGNIHKGLDLLLEAFKDTDLHLHICQWLEPEFKELYSDLLFNKPNIHFENFVKMRSEKFYELVNKCNWVILPTCGEGQPGSVIECMAFGLIPILSDHANIDLENFGIRIEQLTIESVSSTVKTTSNMDISECIKRSERTFNVTAEKYSAVKFKDEFKKAILKILTAFKNVN